MLPSMATVLESIGKKLGEPVLDPKLEGAAKLLAQLVDPAAYVGEVYSLGYEEALVQIHDYHRKQVGGIPARSEVHTSELQSPDHLVCRLLLEKKKKNDPSNPPT